MKKYAFIWDLDGTLIDSYEVILSSLCQTLSERKIPFQKDEILNFILTYSVHKFLLNVSEQFSIPFDNIKNRYSEISEARKHEIKPIRHAEVLLRELYSLGIPNFVFTHKGESAYFILENLHLKSFFKEIIISKNVFERKPNPSAIDYLVEKYSLDKNVTFYVGDRTIDVECANNASVKSILYQPENSIVSVPERETCIIRDLIEIKNLIL